MLAVDISGSMATQDMEVNGEFLDRLTIVKAVVGQFAQARVGDRVGLILFGTNAYLQAPLTFDLKALTGCWWKRRWALPVAKLQSATPLASR